MVRCLVHSMVHSLVVGCSSGAASIPAPPRKRRKPLISFLKYEKPVENVWELNGFTGGITPSHPLSCSISSLDSPKQDSALQLRLYLDVLGSRWCVSNDVDNFDTCKCKYGGKSSQAFPPYFSHQFVATCKFFKLHV